MLSDFGRRFFKFILAGLIGLSVLGGFSYWAVVQKKIELPLPLRAGFKVTPTYLAGEITSALDATNAFPTELGIPLRRGDALRQTGHINSTLDDEYGEIIRGFLERYRPDYGAVAVINPDTGAVLALESFVKDPADRQGHLAIRAPFPAASVFKIVTASAAIDQGKAYAETIIPYNGRPHTLYRKNVSDQAVTRWTQHVTLREAFGKSINVVFGKLGLFHVGVDDLKKYAENFYFNREFGSDIKIEKSHFILDPANMWQLVESAAGFTNRTTLSPIHGALIASAILNDGVMPTPYSVDSVLNDQGESLYEGAPRPMKTVMLSYSARQMQLLMQEVVTHGTSRKPFRGLANEEDFRVGGKTGSLDGQAVQGRTDWFVGYASHNDLRLAVGIVTVNKKYWAVRSSMLARLFFEQVFDKKTFISQNPPRRARHHRRYSKAR